MFCKNLKHLDTMRNIVIDWFRTAGIKNVHSYVVYSDYPDKEKDYKDFCEDNSDSCKVLFSINMLNEGLHIKNISGVLMLRTTQSNLIYLQQLGRLVDADNIDKYLLVFDFVNNFSSVNDGIGLLKEIKDAIAREKENDSDFDNSEFEDIDTFFVLENVIEIKKMFKEIEGRLIGREWSEEEDNILIKYYGNLTIEEIHNRYLHNRSTLAIQKRAQVLGITYKNITIWTDEDIKYLREHFGKDSIDSIALELNKSISSVRFMASKLKLSSPKRPWTKSEDEIVIKYYETEKTMLYKRLNGRTKKSVEARASRLGLCYLNKKNRNKYVYRIGNKNKWKIEMTINGNRYNFGTYDSEDKAIKVAMEKAREYGKN